MAARRPAPPGAGNRRAAGAAAGRGRGRRRHAATRKGGSGGEAERSTPYRGISWNNRTESWQAQICVNRKRTNLGYFDSEEDAARAYDAAARSVGRAVNFRLYDTDRVVGDEKEQESLRAVQAAKAGFTSQYRGVSWSKNNKTWLASMSIGNRPTFLGYFDSEEAAALRYDEGARSLGRAVNFRRLDTDLTVEEEEAESKVVPSPFKGVSWSTRSNKWCARLQHNREKIHLGYWDNEVDAALAWDAAAMSVGRVDLNIRGVGPSAASVGAAKKRIQLGYWDDEDDAAKAWSAAGLRIGLGNLDLDDLAAEVRAKARAQARAKARAKAREAGTSAAGAEGRGDAA